jgi:diacylglycerol kinase family enzyme
VAVVFILAVQLSRDDGTTLSLLARLVMLGAAVLLAHYALTRDVRSLKQSETPGKPVPAARRGVLIMNLKSGGGKAEKFHLVDACRARGIEPVVLQRGDDLLQLARDAIDRGADVVGMAGGDGSQALVASIAAERGVPMVVIPAGTRNHFALDIGLDRDDVVGALDAYGEARERTIDLADVNGRIFVNNVSLGLYATIVQSPEYRDAKRETTLAALPEMLGPGSEPFDLRFTTPDGMLHEGAHVIQVSNGPYGTTTGGITSRPRMDTGQLGVFSLIVPDAVAATRAIAALTTATPALYEGYLSWETPVFEVDSAAPIAVGLDGESLEMDPPLVFTSRPGVLRLRLPLQAIGFSPAARATGIKGLLGLWRVVLGRPVRIDA